VFAKALDKLVVMVTDLGKKLDAAAVNRKAEQALLNTSIKNVQTQLLHSQGRFDVNKSSADSGTGGAAPPTHKLRFPKFDGTGDLLVWLHKGEQFFRAKMAGPASDITAGRRTSAARRHGKISPPASIDGSTPPPRANPLDKLFHLRRTRTVDEY
jgi:hypothetical protein